MNAGGQAARTTCQLLDPPGPATIGKKRALSPPPSATLSLCLLFRNSKWAFDKTGAGTTGKGSSSSSQQVVQPEPNMFNGVIYVGASPLGPASPSARLGCNLSSRAGQEQKIICHLNLKIIYFYEAHTSRALEQWPQGADRAGEKVEGTGEEGGGRE